MKKITKLFTSKSVSVNEKERTAQFIISDDQPDRMDEIVEQSWDTENYKNNPIVLWGHNPSEPENVLGTSLGLETEKDKDVTRTKSTVKFSEEGLNPKADMVFNQIKAGILRTVSVGFIPKTFKTSEDKKDILADNELLEFSIVPIPANPRAVMLAYKDGTISRKDARFMIEAMNKEAELLQEELDSDKNKEEEQERNTKTMSDEDIQKVAEAMSTAFNEAFAPVIEKLNAIADKVGAEDNEDSDNEDDNQEGENQDEKQMKSEADTAKEGEDDHSGADEVDEDTELTPEQEEEFAKEFEKALKEEQEK